MKTEVSVPEIGESVTEGTITAWLKKDGDRVAEGEDLFELETDKATLAIPSPGSGVLSIQVQDGNDVSVGQVVATLEPSEGGEEITEEPAKEKPAPQAREKPEQEHVEKRAVGGRGPREKPAASEVSGGEKAEAKTVESENRLSPAVRRLVEEQDLRPEEIQGSGKDERITKKDVLEEIDRRKSGGGPEKREAPAPGGVSAAETARERQIREKMTTIRKKTAQRLVASRQNAAHLTTFNELDMTNVMRIREEYRESFQEKHGIRLGFMSFFVKACCSALADYPEVNAYLEEDQIVYNNFYDVGIAVSTDRGLLVPVLKDADRKSFAEIESAIRDFAARAQGKKLTVDELSGGTFTITNGGVFGSLLSTPIPNPPQTAILGMHAIQKRAVVVDDEIVIRPMMYVALTYDHRLIDGREAVSFLVRVKELIEDPHRLMLDI
jgi:2-oxoglutarate dehydrogenase E2 component (dihydrolipoamide succinyltransferase)